MSIEINDETVLVKNVPKDITFGELCQMVKETPEYQTYQNESLNLSHF